MKVKVSDYIVDFFNTTGIDTVFTITGGFAMHLNDSFGKNTKYNIYYQHHEQACGYSALGYTKSNNKPCIVCTTAGCAATNTISPCLVAYQDSVPILFISGQVKSTESIQYLNNNNKMNIRHYSGADSDIIKIVSPITKYAKEITNLTELNNILTFAQYHLTNNRPGPVWLSIPVDIQGMFIENVNNTYIKNKINIDNLTKESFINCNILSEVNTYLINSKRPLIIAGNGIKLGNCIDKFNAFINKYRIPVVVSMLATDIIETDNELYSGKIGLIGDRHGNFTLQNCDLLISFGCRMAQGVVGYRSEWFARDAKIIYIDIDDDELAKTNISYNLKINMNLNVFFDNYNFETNPYQNWINKCNYWKKKWIFETPQLFSNEPIINPYHFLKIFFETQYNNKIILGSSGSIVTVLWHMIKINKGDKFIISSQGDMGFELTSAIGCQISEPTKMVIPILGEGSFQLNIQELQTIIQYKLPLKILIFNNGAYGAIEITQKNFFKTKYGVDQSSGISFPDTEKISNAYGIKYISVSKYENITDSIREFYSYNDTIILEVFCCIQGRFPKLSAIKNDDDTFSNRPFEDMEPFLNREDFKNEMIVNII